MSWFNQHCHALRHLSLDQLYKIKDDRSWQRPDPDEPKWTYGWIAVRKKAIDHMIKTMTTEPELCLSPKKK